MADVFDINFVIISQRTRPLRLAKLEVDGPYERVLSIGVRHYRIKGCTPGDFSIRYKALTDSGAVCFEASVEKRIIRPESLKFIADISLAHFRVVRADGLPISNTEGLLESLDYMRRFKTDEDGHIELTVFPPGAYQWRLYFDSEEEKDHSSQ